MARHFAVLTLIIAAGMYAAPAAAAEVRVAVAANFLATLQTLAERYEAGSEDTVVVSSGSTGKLYAQIRHGAPFDVFFAADTRRPQLLEEEGRIVEDSRFTYAVGRLALWSPKPGLIGDGEPLLRAGGFGRLAIANPKTAPYGLAAKQALVRLGLWSRLAPDLVRGENIGQTFQFVATGNADLAFVAASQIAGLPDGGKGSSWYVPTALHAPIEQQAVVLRDHAGVWRFLEFLRGDAARAVIEDDGYTVP